MNALATDELPANARPAACSALPNAAWLPDALVRQRHPPAVRAAPARGTRRWPAAAGGALQPSASRYCGEPDRDPHRCRQRAALRAAAARSSSSCLGPRLKYSSCYYPRGDETLDAGRGGDAGAVRRARRTRRRPAHPRARLRLGLARRCGWPSAIRKRASPRSRTRARSASTSRRSAARAACERAA